MGREVITPHSETVSLQRETATTSTMKAISNPTLRHQCHKEGLISIPDHQSPTVEREARRQTSGTEHKKHLLSRSIKT